MKIGTIIILENLTLQRAISDISGLLSDRFSVESLIGDFILEQRHESIGNYPHTVKVILDKYRTLILQNNCNEKAVRLLIKGWNQHFGKFDEFIPYKKDFEDMIKLVNEGMNIFDIFIGVKNGMLARVATHENPQSIIWKTKTIK